MRKRSHEEYIIKLKEKNPNIECLEKYIDSKTNILHKCIICGYEWSASPGNLVAKHPKGCPNCRNIQTSKRCKKSQEQYIEELNKVNSSITIMDAYIDSHHPILHKCNVCNNQWFLSPTNALRGKGCPICANKRIGELRRMSQNDYENKLLKYSPSIRCIDKYINSTTPILHECLVCGYKWKKKPQHIETGCPNCYNSLPYTKEGYQNYLDSLGKDINIIGNFINYTTNTEHECRKCGTIWSPQPSRLIALKYATGCPSCNVSLGENKIREFLLYNNIKFIYQQTFDNLYGVGSSLLSYDFYLPLFNLLIEYQGEQHKKPVKHFGGENKFKIQQEHDKRKREYALKNNIGLLEIWYYDFNNIETILTEELLNESVTTAG